MTVTERFTEFFRELYGITPYPWQCGLVEEVAATGRWPDLAAPTGAGKSAVVEVHVFLVAEHALGRDVVRPPRRLVLVAPRRGLVDDQFTRAAHVAKRLRAAIAGGDGLLSELAAALDALKTLSASDRPPDEPPVGVWLLRGGVRPDTGWRREPAACQIICATPQMWGSRLLLRGYGASLRSRNVEAGLLGHDAVAIVDEAHLHARLIDTARAVSRLDAGPLPVQVVAMTATQPPAEGQRTIGDSDLEDPALRRRVLARKALTTAEIEGGARELHRALVEHAFTARERIDRDAGSIGVFVNTVASAVSVAVELEHHGTVIVLCGRLRAADVARIRDERPGLISPEGDPSVDFLVATQSLEVGVDLDLPAIITALASANALAQRAGRLNRSGRHDGVAPTFTVITPVGGDGQVTLKRSWTGPYSERELTDATTWLEALGESISPSEVMSSNVPEVPRACLPALRRVDLETLAMTSDPLSADPDPELYLQDPEAERPQVAVIARRHLDDGLDRSVVAAMLLAVPPRAHETAEIGFGGPLERILEVVQDKAWVVRATPAGLEAKPLVEFGDLQPRDTLVVPDGAAVCTAGVLGLGEVSASRDLLRDVLEIEVDGAVRDRVLRCRGADIDPIVEEDPVLATRAAREQLADVIDHEGLARVLRRTRLADLELVWCGLSGAEDQDGLLVLRDLRRRATASPRVIPSELVRLDDHQRDVEDRLERILGALGLGPMELPRAALLAAARDHDSGKRHPHFQDRMGAAGDMLAKPRPGHRPDQGNGWRHEQLSVAFLADRFSPDPLAVALVAAHHGCGRPMFNRGAVDLLDGYPDCPEDVMRWVDELYGEGGAYEQLRDRAQRDYGVHGLAWLEALLCCADRQVSSEGR